MLSPQNLRDSRDKAQVTYHLFSLSTRKFPDGLFCFFEGDRGGDNAYYVPRIKLFTDDYHPFRCSGREKVLKVWDLIATRPEYNKYKKAFFIDRDFNAPLLPCDPPIFETPCYSIENLYVSINVLKDILKNQFDISESTQEFEDCINLFIDRQREFLHATSLFNAWYACLIEIRNETGRKTGVNLEDQLPKDFIDFNLQSVSQNYNLEKIRLTFQNAVAISEEALQQKLTEFSMCDQNKTFRGKYQLWFLLVFLKLILIDSNKDRLVIKRQLKFKFNNDCTNTKPILNIEQALEIFSPYAETPNSLKDYLSEVVK